MWIYHAGSQQHLGRSKPTSTAKSAQVSFCCHVLERKTTLCMSVCFCLPVAVSDSPLLFSCILNWQSNNCDKCNLIHSFKIKKMPSRNLSIFPDAKFWVFFVSCLFLFVFYKQRNKIKKKCVRTSEVCHACRFPPPQKNTTTTATKHFIFLKISDPLTVTQSLYGI